VAPRDQCSLITVLAVALTMASACARPPAPARPPLRIALHTQPLGLDPHHHHEALTFAVLRNFYEALTAFDREMRIGPALAESWENPDELTWVFHLRRGVRFHNGHELTSTDVLFSLNRARRANSGFSSYLVAVHSLSAPDRYSVKLTTTQPYAILLNKLAFVLIVPAGSPTEIRTPIGTGPYELVSFTPGQRIELRSFPQYWQQQPREPRVDLLPVNDAPQRTRLLEQGAADLIDEPGNAQLPSLNSTPHCRTLRSESLLVSYLLLKTDRPPLADVRVRRAISLALDRPALVAADLNGEGHPIGQMVGRNVFGFAPAIEAPVRDLGAARSLLAAAGYSQGIDLELEYRHGRHGDEVRKQLAEAGIRVRLRDDPWSQVFPRLQQRKIDFYLGLVLAPSADASDLFDAMVHSRDPRLGYGDSNYNDFHNPELDTLIEQSGSTLDMAQRREQLQRAMRILTDDLSFIPMYVPFAVYGLRDDVVWQPRRDGFILAAEVHRQ
jgi:peptide/nickel transport system substrate-binding protein